MVANDYQAEINQQRVNEVLAGFTLPSEIKGIDVDYGTDHTGDPAVFLSFHVKERAELSREDVTRLSRFVSDVGGALLEAGVGGFPYTRLDEAA